MKKLFFTTLLFALIGLTIQSQPLTCQWAKNASGDSHSNGSSTCTDASGNVYVTGGFLGQTMILGSYTLTNSFYPFSAFMFIAKYDNLGNVLWAKGIGNNLLTFGYGISADISGNVIVTGHYNSATITFGNITLTNTGRHDVFIVKYDPSGTVLWAKSATGSGIDISQSISTDALGNLFIAGFFESPTITFGSFTLTNAGAADVFIVKYDATGNVIWARSIGGAYIEDYVSISSDAAGNNVVTGNYSSPSINIGSATLTNSNTSISGIIFDVFIAKYDHAGNSLWAEKIEGSFHISANSNKIDASGNIIITGSFTGPSVTIGDSVLNNAGYHDAYIAKYSGSGNPLWAKRIGDTDTEMGQSVCTDMSGNIFLTGTFNSASLTIEGITLLNTGASAAVSSSDVFITEYDAAGNMLWSTKFGGSDDDFCRCMHMDAHGKLVFTGDFKSPGMQLGNINLTNLSTGSYPTSNFYIARVNEIPVGLAENKHSNLIRVFPNPFSTQAVLQSGDYLQNVTFIIANSHGQVVKQITNFSGYELKLSRGDLAAGLYFIQLIRNGKTISIEKLLVID